MRVARWFGFALVVAAGCGESTWEVTRSGAHAGADAGTDGGTCAGQCAPEYPETGWQLVTLWLGPEGEAPYCGSASDGYIDLMVSNDCPACACEPSLGTCKLPESITVHSETCGQPGSTDTSFDPPADWNGTCNGDTAIPADCGGVPCARSVTIGPMAIVDESCAPTAEPIPHAGPSRPTWGNFAKGCVVSEQTKDSRDLGTCVFDENCLPKLDASRYCYRKDGDAICSGGFYTDRIVVYQGYDDQRRCTDCTCGAPQGSACEALANMYEDSMCVQPAGGCLVDSVNSCCVDVLPGTALGSKAMTPPTYIPGICQAMGGTVEGTVEPIGPKTYCCPPPDE